MPNVLTTLRILGSPILPVLALVDRPVWLGAWVILLALTEWADGFLARGLNEQSATGARLDTVADIVFYASLLAAFVLWQPRLLQGETIWIGLAVVSYLGSWLASGIKFRTMPSYHTWSAKGAWLVIGIGTASLLAGWSPWPFRVAMLSVVAANLEAIAITAVLSRSLVDVPSLWHALRREEYRP